jgi:multidrug resistance efflux pump
MKVGDPVRVGVDTYPDGPTCGYVEAILPAFERNQRSDSAER